MYTVVIRYFEELNFFLPRERRDRDNIYTFQGRRSVKDLIENMGIPHVEVDVITVNGTSVDFSYIVNNGDKINVFPDFKNSDTSGVKRLRLSPLHDTKFVLDVHLRKLARVMRLMGFDVDYADHRDDPALADIALRENRILLTCDRQLLMRKVVKRGYIIRSRDPDIQIIEVIERLHLHELINPFTRCIECNGIIQNIDIDHTRNIILKESVPEGVLSWCREFFRCTSCDKIYWRGSHYDRLSLKLEKVISMLNDNYETPQ